MTHTIRFKSRLLARIRRIKGQTVSIERALLAEHPCSDILQQLAAIRGAVNGLMMEVLEGHIRKHVGCDDMLAEQREESVEQVVKVIRSYMK